jgi:DNA-binding MarR family transcriptional regulator
MAGYDENILRSLRKITRAIDIYSRQLASKHGLTGPQLVCLRAMKRRGPITLGELAREVELSQATVTGIIDRLSSQELVQRERNTDDRRRVTVHLTPAGETIIAKAPSPLQERFREELSLLPDTEQAQIEAVLVRVVKMMDAEHIDAAPLLTTGPSTADADTVRSLLDAE